MTLPTIHPNGTPKRMLLEGLMKASTALDAAYEAIKQTAPNGRDFYPQGPAAMDAALDEHSARLTALDAIKDELGTLMAAICAL